jgi:hypothetical protein
MSCPFLSSRFPTLCFPRRILDPIDCCEILIPFDLFNLVYRDLVFFKNLVY